MAGSTDSGSAPLTMTRSAADSGRTQPVSRSETERMQMSARNQRMDSVELTKGRSRSLSAPGMGFCCALRRRALSATFVFLLLTSDFCWSVSNFQRQVGNYLGAVAGAELVASDSAAGDFSKRLFELAAGRIA